MLINERFAPDLAKVDAHLPKVFCRQCTLFLLPSLPRFLSLSRLDGKGVVHLNVAFGVPLLRAGMHERLQQKRTPRDVCSLIIVTETLCARRQLCLHVSVSTNAVSEKNIATAIYFLSCCNLQREKFADYIQKKRKRKKEKKDNS